MEKKATRAAAITKVATRAKPAQAAVRTATAVKEVQAAATIKSTAIKGIKQPTSIGNAVKVGSNAFSTTGRNLTAAQKELLEKAKTKAALKEDLGRGILPGKLDINQGIGRGRGGRDFRPLTPTSPHINPDILNPYLTASGSILPVSPAVISFVYSLDGQAKKANSPKDYDEQWKGCVFDSWHTGTGPIKIISPSFFEKDILEQPERRVVAVRFKENVSDEEKLKKQLETPASELKNLREILNKNTRLKK